MAFPVPSAPKRRPSGPVAALPTVEEVSAGGIVVDFDSPDLPVAIIARINRGGRLEWCLPKGHPENEETDGVAAVREIEEETGIAGRVISPLGSIDYWFSVSGHRVHKTVHHFLLRAVGGVLSDADVEVTEVAWVPLDELSGRLAYADERALVERAPGLLADTA